MSEADTAKNLAEIDKHLSPESTELISKIAGIVRSDTRGVIAEISLVAEVTIVEDGGSTADDLARICDEEGGELGYASGDTEIYCFKG